MMPLSSPDAVLEEVRAPALAIGPRHAVTRIGLRDYRSYERARITTKGGPVVLFGPNGAGKTNLLEALSLLVPGRGLRGARLAEIDRLGGGPFVVDAQVETSSGPAAITTGRAQDGGRERRRVHIDGAPVPGQAVLGEIVSMVWLTPAMDRLFTDAPAERRRFLDHLVMAGEPGHAGQLARYQYALRERSRLLRDGRFDPAWLGALEARAAASGVAVAASRRVAIAHLNRALAAAEGVFPRATASLEGEIELALDETPALEVEDRFAASLAAARHSDAESGATAHGPHRTDLLVADAATGRPARLGSTGQQKALLVSLILAEVRLRAAEGGRLPILLLDEVAAHLDALRRAELFRVVTDLGAQTWLAGTDPEVFRPLIDMAHVIAVNGSTLESHG